MFASVSVEIVKSLVCKRISHSVSKSKVRRFSSLLVKKTCEPQSLYCCSEKCFPTLKCHAISNVSGFHGCSHRGPTVLGNLEKTGMAQACSYQTKSKDFNKEDDDNSEIDNKGRNLLDDLEFQSILKDFAQDFGVNEETHLVLEEIKRQHHGPVDREKPLGKASSADSELEFRNDSQVRTTKCSSVSNDKLQEFNVSSVHSEETEDDSEEFFHIDQELKERTDYDDKRGKEGVYDIDDLVTVLRKENLHDICVIQVPVSFHYADYLVLATAKSPRQCHAVMEFIIKLYKKKKNKKDPFVKCEGKTVATWKVLDMGNIVLHLFLEDTRSFYDIESLWLLDKMYDDARSVKKDPDLDMMQQHMNFLNSLNPQ